MNAEGSKSIIKTAYLLQLKHGPFTEEEFSERLGLTNVPKQVEDLLNLNYLTRHEGVQPRYSITESGRAQIRVVLAGGVYDVLHVGHLAGLKEAKSLGDALVVVVATDITVQTFKSRKPIFPEEERRLLVEAMKPVDKAILGYEDVGMGYEEVLMEVMPDIVAFGYDQENLERSVREIIERKHLNIKMVKLSMFDSEKYPSSTAVRQRLSEELR